MATRSMGIMGFWLLVLVAPSLAATYTTNFSLTENPISEGGHWTNGAASGIDWGDVSTTPGLAIGHSGSPRYADATALLTGTWGPDQMAQATVFGGATNGWPEVELRLRSSLSAHHATGYEISERVTKDDSGYLIIVRWNGPLADFTYLANLHDKKYGVSTGDVVKATIVGHTITAYKNGVQLAQVTDNTYSTGNPGIGFNEGKNGDYGFTSFMASDNKENVAPAANSDNGPLTPPRNGAGPSVTGNPPITAPLRHSTNPNYFEDANGTPIILCGSHSWNTLQDWGANGAIRKLDFDAFVRFLKAHGHNFTLLWHTELPEFRGLPTTENAPPDITVSPHPWIRTGPGNATDGGLKFDLNRFDQSYFDRLRARVQALGKAGIYAGIYLFTGEWLLRFRYAGDGYPFSGPNNVNGVDDGYRGGSAETAVSSATMTAPNTITGFQDAYVRKTIDTLNDLPNVLWIVSEEAPSHSTWWNNHLIALVREYESRKRYQHPIGYAALENPPDSILYNSDADWVAPTAWLSPTVSSGTGKPARKVNVNDSDHSYFGMWNDTPQKNRNYAWENFTNGNQVLFMDPYLVYYPRQNRNLCTAPVNGIGDGPDPRWENFRNNLGYILSYSRKLNLANVTPRSSLCSTRFCLAQTPSTGAEYLVYAPSGGSFTVDLSAMPASRMLSVEWFNPATGTTLSQKPIAAGAASQRFNPPFVGDAVLYLVDTAGHK